MRMWPDCISCITHMSLKVADTVLQDNFKMKMFAEKVSQLKSIDFLNQDITSPEAIRDIWGVLIQLSGITDPLLETKKRQNDLVLRLYPAAKESVMQSPDPFASALQFSLSGNALDIMTGQIKKSPEKIIKKLKNLPLQLKDVQQLKERLRKAKTLLYIGDNCGEIVFDKLFIEIIKEVYSLDITFITRTFPVLNDVTKEDAMYVAIDKTARVIENGIPEPLPGTILKKLSNEVKKLVHESDLIIAKGGGNYDTLTEESVLKGKISFLLQAKCKPYCTIHQVPLGSLIIFNY